MSYVVLARKYRPLRFEDMVGQEHVGRTLANAIAQNRVHHAYLFAGARGLGKTTTARIFAKGLVCEAGPTAQPCNACEQCVAVNESRSVDVIEVDGASNNSVDNIRQLREQVHYLPQSARRKVYIIDEVHMLTTQAFNALLKTLEEPPEHVNFIFATTEPQKVLPTILSRVSRMDFRRLSVEELVAHLQSILQREDMGMDEGALRIIARAAGGSVRDAMTLLDQVIAFADDPSAISEEETRRVLGQAERQAIVELVDAILEHAPDQVVRRFDALVAAGHDMMVLSMQLLEHLRDLTLVAVCRSRDVLRGVTDSEYEALQQQAGKTQPIVVGQLFDRFTRVVDRLPTSRVPRLLVEMGLLDLAHAEPLMPLGDLVEELRALADGSSGSGGGGGGSMRRPPSRPQPTGGRAPSPRRSAQGASTAAPASQPVEESAPPASPTPSATSPSTEAANPTPAPTPAPPSSPAAPVEASFEGSELMKGLWQMARTAVRTDEPTTATTATTDEATAPPSSPAPPSAQDDAPSNGATASEGAEPRGPCTPRPPRTDVIDVDNLAGFEAWEALVSRIRAEDEYVSAVLSEVGLIAIADGVLRVAASPRSFAHKELTGRPEVRSQVEQATRDHFGRPFTLELVDGEASLPDRPSIVLVEAQRAENHQREVEAEARQHQVIVSLLQTFDAKLASTKPDSV